MLDAGKLSCWGNLVRPEVGGKEIEYRSQPRARASDPKAPGSECDWRARASSGSWWPLGRDVIINGAGTRGRLREGTEPLAGGNIRRHAVWDYDVDQVKASSYPLLSGSALMLDYYLLL